MRNQQGITMVSLLVGLLISMLCLIALLTLFRTVVHTSVESRQTSIRDTQWQNGLMMAQLLVQNAGSGMLNEAPAPHYLLGSFTENNILGTTTAPFNAIVWRYLEIDDDGIKSLICKGIADIPDSDNKAPKGGRKLVILKNEANTCSNDITEIKWLEDDSQDVLARSPAFVDQNPVQFIFENGNPCVPYGIGDTQFNQIIIKSQNNDYLNMELPICLIGSPIPVTSS